MKKPNYQLRKKLFKLHKDAYRLATISQKEQEEKLTEFIENRYKKSNTK